MGIPRNKVWINCPNEKGRTQVLAVSAPGGIELNKDVLSAGHDLRLKGGISQDGNGGDNLDDRRLDTRLLGDKGSQGVKVTSTRVILGVAVDTLGEPLEGGEPLDAVAGSEFTVGISIDLGDQDLLVLAAESLSKFLVDLRLINCIR